MAEIALYHPWIDPDDASLLKTAALYWDEIRTIAPESMREPYAGESSSEAYREGFLKPRHVSPECREVVQASAEFASDVGSKAIRAEVRRARSASGPYGREPVTLHPKKLSSQLQQALFSDFPQQPDGFYRVGEGFATAYMSRLAAVVAEADRLSPLTDVETSQGVVVDRHVEVAAEELAKAADGELARLTLQAIGIRPEVPLLRILRFRDAHREKLDRFRRHVRRLCRGIAKPGSAQRSQHELEGLVRDEVQPGLDELRAKLREHSVAFGVSALDVTQACTVGLLGSGFSDWLYGVAGGVVSLAISTYRARREKKALLEENPLSYLLEVREGLA